MSEIETLCKKLIKGIDTKYIKDLDLMKDFNEADYPESDKVIEQFFEEMIRMLLELKMAFTNKPDYMLVEKRLNYFLFKSIEILHVDFETAMKLKEEILK